MNFQDLLAGRPVEIGAGIALLLTGVVLPVWLSDLTAITLLGPALAAIGGVLISHSTDTVNKRERATDVLKHELETLSRNLGATAGQISNLIHEVNAGIHETERGIALISVCTNSLFSHVNDLNTLIGSASNYDELVSSYEDLNRIASSISSLRAADPRAKENGSRTQNRQLEAIQRDLRNVREKIQSASTVTAPGAAISYRSEQVTCPYCSNRTTISLGVQAGETSAPVCNTCKQRFNAHRRGDNSIIVRPSIHASSTPKPAVTPGWSGELSCPNELCDNVISVRLPNTEELTKRACTECYQVLHITPEGKVDSHAPGRVLQARFTDESTTRSDCRLECPDCQEERRPWYKGSENSVALCETCDSILICQTPPALRPIEM